MSMKRKVTKLKNFIVPLGVVFLVSITVHAQTPTLALAAANAGISGGNAGRATSYNFQMEASGWPRAVTAGETVLTMGSWPSGNNPAMSDDQSNIWNAVPNCTDSQSITHGFYYVANAAANTSMITQSFGSTATRNSVLDWAVFYNMATSSIVDNSSCTTGVTPSNNTAPNISGTAYTTTTNGDLIVTCVYVEQSSFGPPNPISSITFPSGFTGLSEDTSFGHACAYEVQTTAGSFTPAFTVAQGTHNSFTIMSVAIKAGSGGTAPGTGASILLSEKHFMADAAGNTDTVYLPCPTGTTNVTVMDDSGDMTSVSDNNSNTYTTYTHGFAVVSFVNDPTISNGNAFTVSMKFNSSGSQDLVGLFCVGNTSGADTAATPQNNSSLYATGSGATYNSGTESGTALADAPSLGTSVAGDLVLSVGGIGVGPATGCMAEQCVFDDVGSTSWTNGDDQAYSNGNFMAHYYASTASTVQFEYNVVNNAASWSSLALALKPKSSQGTVPAPPTNLTATVH
jgi:hypothetical protein